MCSTDGRWVIPANRLDFLIFVSHSCLILHFQGRRGNIKLIFSVQWRDQNIFLHFQSLWLRASPACLPVPPQ